MSVATPTADRYERQLRQELLMKEEGERRLKSRTLEAEQRAYASSSVYGRTLLNSTLGILSKHIESKRTAILKGKAGEAYHVVAGPLLGADPEVLALITLKITLDVMCQAGKPVKPTYTNVCNAIGRAVEVDLKIAWYKSVDPDLAERIQAHFHPSSGTRQKATVFRLRFTKEGHEWKKWSSCDQMHVGAWLLNRLQDCTGWISLNRRCEGVKNTSNYITMSDEFYSAKEAILERAETLAYCVWPMLCEPLDWTLEDSGGFLTGPMRDLSLVRGTRKHPLYVGGPYLAMLNRLQGVPYTVNNEVLQVAEDLFERGISVGTFHRQTHIDPPPRPGEGADEETIRVYKRDRRIIEDKNAQLRRINWRTTEAMYVARKYKDEDRFWIPWNFDYRGRVYPISHMLSPQGTDFDKSLLLFAEPGPVNDWWLAFHVANTYGLDKASMAERVEWTSENYHLISSVATDPIGNLDLWASASEPWCFLAACFEFYRCTITGASSTSNLPIGIDATCSGLQHLAAMTLDGTAAAMVNVTPSERPVDGYRIVADHAQSLLGERHDGWMNRRVTKRTVMTVPYGVSRHSSRGYIREALIEQGRTLEKGDLTTITNAVFKEAVPKIFPGPVAVMQWLQESAREIIKRGDESITWTTPSGFVVKQDLRKIKTRRVQTQLLGSGRIRSSVFTGLGEVDLSHHVAALAPNFVHSLDASLLHFSFSECTHPFSLVHDCVYGRSCDMDSISKEVRLHFTEMYKGDPLNDWATQVGVTVPEGLMKNTLDLDLVNNSEYFFC